MSPVKIPLRARSGEVRAFALVDADMAPSPDSELLTYYEEQA
jgi:hypothetical protein